MSRALRNRCLLIDIDYRMDEDLSELSSDVIEINKDLNDLVQE